MLQIGKPDKTPNIFYISQLWPVENCVNFGRIDSNLFDSNNESKISDFFDLLG